MEDTRFFSLHRDRIVWDPCPDCKGLTVKPRSMHWAGKGVITGKPTLRMEEIEHYFGAIIVFTESSAKEFYEWIQDVLKYHSFPTAFASERYKGKYLIDYDRVLAVITDANKTKTKEIRVGGNVLSRKLRTPHHFFMLWSTLTYSYETRDNFFKRYLNVFNDNKRFM